MSIPSTLNDESIQFNKIIYLGAQPDPCEDLRELIEFELDSQEIVALFKDAGVSLGKASRSAIDAHDVEEFLHGIAWDKNDDAFLIQAVTPVPSAFSDTGYSFTWGHTTYQWFYTKQINEAFIQRVLIWRRRVLEERREQLAQD